VWEVRKAQDYIAFWQKAQWFQAFKMHFGVDAAAHLPFH
jgi:hypothetical protein